MREFADDGQPAGGTKLGLRRAILARRHALAPAERAAAAQQVQSALAGVIRAVRPALLTAYVPVGSEPGGSRLPEALAAALTPRGVLLLPILLPDLDLDWGRYVGPETLRPAGRGLREPPEPRLGVTAVSAADLVVVPALAVDRCGNRLGRGGGSYDRALARVRDDVLVVALLHDGELVDRIAAEPHDRRVGAVVTPAGGFQPIGA